MVLLAVTVWFFLEGYKVVRGGKWVRQELLQREERLLQEGNKLNR